MRLKLKKRELIDPREWHPFFALLPHRVDDFTMVWLERAERRLLYQVNAGLGVFEYRLPQEGSSN